VAAIASQIDDCPQVSSSTPDIRELYRRPSSVTFPELSQGQMYPGPTQGCHRWWKFHCHCRIFTPARVASRRVAPLVGYGAGRIRWLSAKARGVDGPDPPGEDLEDFPVAAPT
jgi:hypothetical protein